MPEAELNITTKHDGTQAERSISRLESSIDRFAKNVTNKLGNKFFGSVFGAGAIAGFVSQITQAIDDVGRLLDKVKEGKSTIKEFKAEAGLDPGHAGALAGMSEASKQTKIENKNQMSFLARAFYGILGSVIPFGGGAQFSTAFEKKRAHALMGDLGTLGVAAMEGKVANQKARLEAQRQQRIKEIIDREYGPAEGTGGFGYQAGPTGKYFGPGFPDSRTLQIHKMADIEYQQLMELKRIMRVLDQGPSTGGGTTFPR